MKYFPLFFLLVFVACKTTDIPQITDPKVTEKWNPEPIVVATKANQAPSDATVLFSGKDLNAWQKPQFLNEFGTVKEMKDMVAKLSPKAAHPAADWTISTDDYFAVNPGKGGLETKQAFGSMQLHVEWLSPLDEGKEGQAYSNSGIFLMGLYEVQVLNSYQNRTYSNGQAGSVYKQHIPLANPANPPGTWQTYDIVFSAPSFHGNSLIRPAYVTVLWNGVLVQNHVELEGPTAYIGKSSYFPHPARMPLRLQDHGDKVQFRNIWVREL